MHHHNKVIILLFTHKTPTKDIRKKKKK